jgi:hypothetical protein
MSNQHLLTVAQATNIQRIGHAEFVANEASIRPDQHRFTDFEELKAYLGQVLGAKVEGQGVRGAMSRKGRYSRRAAEGGQLVTFGDPVLDAIASADGVLVIGDQTIDLREGDRFPTAPLGADESGVAYAAPNLKLTGTVNGAERWASDDGSLVEYRLGTGRLYFHAWKKRTHYGYWSIGAEISIVYTPAKFDAAHIESRYYMSVDRPCQVVKADRDSSRNESYLDEYEWGWNSPQPERVAALCRAVWHNARFADVVTAGDGCDNSPSDPNDPWPAGFPSEWNTISTSVNLGGDWTDGSTRRAVISVEFTSLTIDMSAFNRPAASGSVLDWNTIEVTFPDDTRYTGSLQAPNRIRWSNNSVWTKVINTGIDLNGNWTDGSDRTAAIYAGAKSITIDMSDFDRPNATGSIVDSSTISVKFPDDRTYTGQVQTPNTIRWSNGSVWTKKL